MTTAGDSHQIRQGSSGAALLLAASAVGGLTFFLDPTRGRTRRALVRDQLVHARRKAADAAAVSYRDLKNRALGLGARARHGLTSGAAPDPVLESRVRVALSQSCAHPRAISVAVQDGIVELRGPVLASEVEDVRRTARAVRGVRGIADALEVHERPDSIPALQGPGRQPSERWTPAKRGLVTLGAASAALPLLSRLATPGRVLGALPALGSLALGAAAFTVAQQERAANRRAGELAAREAEQGSERAGSDEPVVGRAEPGGGI